MEERVKELENKVAMLELENKQIRDDLVKYVDTQVAMVEKKAESYFNG